MTVLESCSRALTGRAAERPWSDDSVAGDTAYKRWYVTQVET